MSAPPAPGLRAFTFVAALVAWAAVALQLVLSLQLAVANGRGILGGIVVYLSYFTILTNILVALTLSVPLAAPKGALGRFFARPGVATAVATAITVVGLAYFFLLRRIWDPQGWALVADVALHYVVPVLFLLYWGLAVPKGGLRFADIPKWLLYPLGYMVYVLIRGALTGLYPYYFIDASVLGYGAAFVNALGVLVGFVVVAAALVLVARATRPGSRDVHPECPGA